MSSISQLGYLGFEVSNLDEWHGFATEVLGLVASGETAKGGRRYRMDSFVHRFVIEPGESNDLAFIGWQCADDAALDGLVARLRSTGIEVREGSAELAKARHVRRIVQFTDPAGIPSELFCQLEKADTPFRSPVVQSGFVGDDFGMGHLVLSANSQAESQRFYCEMLGLKFSDRIVADVHGYHVDIAFLHANRRHHSVAFGDKQRKRLHHFLLEARSMDEVGLAFDRTLRSGARIMQTLGRHPNDQMFSFYAKTPSGFQFEFGWGAREVDDATWKPTTYNRISEWGHHPPEFLAPKPRNPQ